MNKQVLVLSTSPRKGGNSDTLCDEFVRGVMDAGNQAEKIFLRDRTINYCTGCGVCYSTHKCVQKDDMAEILEKMISADVIVMATPVYFYTMNAQLKTLIDRTVPGYLKISNKDFYFIVTAADPDKSSLERTINGLHGYTEDCLDNAAEKGILYAPGVWQAGEIQGTPAMKQAYEMGRNV